jgi:hypothetical protein
VIIARRLAAEAMRRGAGAMRHVAWLILRRPGAAVAVLYAVLFEAFVLSEAHNWILWTIRP